MAGPEVVVAFDSEGAARVKKELGATDKQLSKIDKRLAKLQERAALKELENQSEGFRKAQERLAKAQGKLNDELTKTQKVFAKMGDFSNRANEISEFAGRTVQAAQALIEFAQAGAEAAAVAQAFEALGAAVPTMEALREASAGVIDDTTLQRLARLGSELGLSAEEMEGATQRAVALASETGQLGKASEVLEQLLKGEAEGLRNLGVAVDTSADKFKDLTEAQKKLAVTQEQAALGSQEQVDALDANQVALVASATSVENLVSELSVMIAEVLAGSGLLETLATLLGLVEKAFVILGPAIELAAGALKFMADVTEIFLGPAAALLDAISDQSIAHEDAAKFIKGHVEALVALRKEQMKHTDASKEFSFGLEISAAGANKLVAEINKLDAQMSLAVGGFDQLSKAQINALQKTRDFEQTGQALEDMITATIAAKDSFEAMDETTARAILGNQAYEEVAGRLNLRFLQLTDVHDDYLDILDTSTEATNKDEEASKARAEAKKKEADALRELQKAQEEQLAFEQSVLTEALIAQEQEIQAEYLTSIELLERRNNALAWFRQLQEETLPVLEQSLANAIAQNEQADIAAEKLEAFNAAQEATGSAFVNLGNSISFAGHALGSAGDKVESLVGITFDLSKALKESQNATQKFGASIAAGKALTASVIDDTTSQAAILGLFELAEAAANFANPVAAAGHGVAAGLYFAVAAKGGKGGGGGAAAGAGGGETAAQPTVAEIAEEPALPTGGVGSTNIFNIESLNPEGSGESVIQALNQLAEGGSGAVLNPGLIGEQQGRPGN